MPSFASPGREGGCGADQFGVIPLLMSKSTQQDRRYMWVHDGKVGRSVGMWVRDDRIGLMIEGRVLEELAIGRRLRRHFAESEPELIGCDDTYVLAGRFVRRWLQPAQARAAERGECESKP